MNQVLILLRLDFNSALKKIMNKVVDADTGRGFQLARLGATQDVCQGAGLKECMKYAG